ncbi:arfaptin-2-like [Panonychus citri]|uniref:arfaptin-2-like n=1 Tax=Panonychus citri TaxID=50023 RepID=UPI0023073705|nr:arfaptin-2-like [Panonychus citri]
MSSNFGTVNPLHYSIPSSPEMTEISIEETNNATDVVVTSKDNNISSRPATLPVSSPFGPPGLPSTTSSYSTKNGIDSETNPSISSNYPLGSTPKSTPIEAIKEWSITTFKCTKQLVNEKLGKVQRTIDTGLESEIDKLRETQKKYSHILRIARDMSSMYSSLVQQQILLYESLSDLSLKEPKVDTKISSSSSSVTSNVSGGGSSVGGGDGNGEDVNNSLSSLNLSADFRQNAEMLRLVSKNGEKLILALRFFCSNLSTLVNKTIDDTIVTIRQFEQARLEYDAERNSVANLLPAQAAAAASTENLIAARAKYERLRQDVIIKLKFLDENKAKVMHKQLILFHNAFTAYASGNASTLDSTLRQFSIKATPQSWLEK